jgi:hypothetical protein
MTKVTYSDSSWVMGEKTPSGRLSIMLLLRSLWKGKKQHTSFIRQVWNNAHACTGHDMSMQLTGLLCLWGLQKIHSAVWVGHCLINFCTHTTHGMFRACETWLVCLMCTNLQVSDKCCLWESTWLDRHEVGSEPTKIPAMQVFSWLTVAIKLAFSLTGLAEYRILLLGPDRCSLRCIPLGQPLASISSKIPATNS